MIDKFHKRELWGKWNIILVFYERSSTKAPADWLEHCRIEWFTFLHRTVAARAGIDFVKLSSIVTNWKNIQDQWGHMNPLLSTEDFSNLDNLKKCFKKLDYGICSPDLAFWRLMHFARIYQIFPLVKYLINENQRKAKLMSNSSCFLCDPCSGYI